MAYRASATEPKTAWARHLDGVMRERGWSRVRLFEEVGASLGYGPKSRSAFLPLLVDMEPDDGQAAILARFFGEPTEADAPPPVPVLDPYAVMLRYTEAMEALTAELQAARTERAETADRLGLLESLVDGLVSQALAAEPRPRVPRETAGSDR